MEPERSDIAKNRTRKMRAGRWVWLGESRVSDKAREAAAVATNQK